jgi:YVTN family beta-propeller protein
MKEFVSGKKHRGTTLRKAMGITTLALLLLVSITGATPYAYVTNSGSKSVSVIDTATNNVAATIPVGTEPYGIAVSPDGMLIYVANSADTTVDIINSQTYNIIATVGYPYLTANPWGIAVTPNGKKVYVTNWRGSDVSVINTTTNAVKSVFVGARPEGVAISPDGTKAYVANSFDGTVSVIDTSTDIATTVLNAANDPWSISNPTGIAISPDGKSVFVTEKSDGVLLIYDTTTKTSKSVSVGKFPSEVAVSPDGTKAYVVNSGSYPGYNGTVSIIDTATNTITATVPVGNNPYGITVNSDGSKVYVTNMNNNTVSIIDTTKNNIIATVGVSAAPFEVVIGETKLIYPVANFTRNVTSGYAPLAVQFNDTSTGTPIEWDWNFGDGGTSNQQNPTHIYSTSGTYTVTLTVSNTNGSSSSKTSWITVIPPISKVNISFVPQTVSLHPGSTQNVQIVMNKVPSDGLAGFNVTISVLDPAIVNITVVSPPGWAGVSATSSVPASSVWITAANFGQVHAGDTNVSFGNITISGIKNGTTNLSIVPTEIDDLNGGLIDSAVTMCKVNVVQIPPFPPCPNPPLDSNNDGLYEDINGNGRLDFADVVTFFSNMQWIKDNGLTAYFDYNHNGRIDFSDVVMLFNMH